MPTLGNIHGGSLSGLQGVGDAFSSSLGQTRAVEERKRQEEVRRRAAMEKAQQQQAQQQSLAEQLLITLGGGVPGAQTPAQQAPVGQQQDIGDLAQINPQMATVVNQVVEQQNVPAAQQLIGQASEGVATSGRIAALSTHEERRQALLALAKQKLAAGEQEAASEAIKLANTAEPEMKLRLTQKQAAGQQVQKTLTDFMKTAEQREAFAQVAAANPQLGQLLLSERERGLARAERTSVRASQQAAKQAEQAAKAAQPRSELGKTISGIQADVQRGWIAPETGQKVVDIARQEATAKQSGKFQTKIGKLISDAEIAKGMFGDDSPQAEAFATALDGEAKGEAPKLSDVGGIRKEFTKLSGNFVTLRDAMGKINAAAANPSAAGDLAMIFSFMKINDPESVIRESEFNVAQHAAGWPERLQASANRVMNGQRLSEAQRNDFVETAQRQFANSITSHLGLEKEFTGVATRANMNPQDVIIDFMGTSRPPEGATPDVPATTTTTAAAMKAGSPTATGPDGQQVILIEGVWVPVQ